MSDLSFQRIIITKPLHDFHSIKHDELSIQILYNFNNQ